MLRHECSKVRFVGIRVLLKKLPVKNTLACAAGRRKEGRSVRREGGGTACKDAIVFSVFFVHQINVKILIGQIL